MFFFDIYFSKIIIINKKSLYKLIWKIGFSLFLIIYKTHLVSIQGFFNQQNLKNFMKRKIFPNKMIIEILKKTYY